MWLTIIIRYNKTKEKLAIVALRSGWNSQRALSAVALISLEAPPTSLVIVINIAIIPRD